MNRGLATLIGAALLLAASPALAQPQTKPQVQQDKDKTVPKVTIPKGTIAPTVQLPKGVIAGPCVGAKCPKPSAAATPAKPTPAAKPTPLVLPYRTTTSELVIIGRAGEKVPSPPPADAFKPKRFATDEIIIVGRAGEKPPPPPAPFTPVRVTAPELAVIGTH